MRTLSFALGVTGVLFGLSAWGCGTSSQDGDAPPSQNDAGQPSVDGSVEGSSDGGGSSTGDPGADASVAPSCPSAPSTDPLVIAIDKGAVRGKQAGSGFAFLGIPFAKPPVGSLRLMPPVAPDCWTDVKDATNYGNMCVQTQLAMNQTAVVGNEDCLTVNVWTPKLPSASSQPLPVLVFKHGGFFVEGASNQADGNGVNLYDGQELANTQNAVVVTFNYRLGSLGFLAHPALAAANPQHTTGNYGLLDSLLVLQWVQENITWFGGDKAHVMLFGESAGAIDTCALVSSPLAKGLFSSALMESGNCAAETLDYRVKEQAEILDTVKCANAADVVACLQSADLVGFVQGGGNAVVGKMLSRDLINVDPAHFMTVPLGPTVDKYVLEDVPLKTIEQGKHNHVPLTIGTNARELAWLLPHSLIPASAGVSCLVFQTFVNAMFPANGLFAKLIGAYPCNWSDPDGGFNALISMTSDGYFTCPSRRALRAAAKTQTEPVYRYLYTHTHSSGLWAPLGAAHAGELAFVWQGFTWFGMTPTADETTLSQQVQGYWANFARTGNPNGGSLPLWNANNATTDKVLELAAPIQEISNVQSTGCDVWDAVQ